MSENNLAAGDVVDPPVELVDPPVAAVTDPAVDPPIDPPVDDKTHGNAGKPPWYMKRISEEAERARRESDRAAAAERRAQEAEALAQRLSAANGTDPAVPPATRPAPATEDRQAEIRAEAQKQRFFEDTLEVRNHGMSEFGPAFGETLNILGALGATSDEFIADVLAIDKSGAHKILKQIAEDPERAVALTGMNSRQRIAELTRMTMAEAKTKTTETIPTTTVPAKTVSKAPPPPPPVTASTSKTIDWRADDTSEEDFDKAFWANQKDRKEKRMGVR